MRQELWNELPHLGAMALCFFSFVVLLGNWIKPIVPRHRLSLARTRQLLLAVAVGSLMLLWLFLNPSVDGLDLGDSCAVYQRRSLEPPSFAKIIMSFTPNQASFAGLALQVNRRYAQRHGYRFQNHVGCAPRSRAPQWTKIALLLNELAARDAPRWVVWIDADAVFTDHATSLEMVLDGLDPKVTLVVGPDMAAFNRPLNTGWIAVRKESVPLLMSVWNCGAQRRLRWAFGHEQQCLSELMEQDPVVATQVVILKSTVGLFGGKAGTERHQWNPSHLVGHAAGWPNKLAGLQQLLALAHVDIAAT